MFKPICLSLFSSLILLASTSTVWAQSSPQPERRVISQENSLGSLLKSPQFSIFSSLLDQADLLGAIDKEENITLFVPDNKAFGQIAVDMLPRMRQDPKYLRYFLLSHMHRDQLQLDSQQESTETSSRIGTELLFSIRDGLTYVNEARVIQGNLQARNGVIHIINRPLLPPVRDLSNWDPNSGQSP